MINKDLPKPVPTDENQPDAASHCPRCRTKTGFRWSPKERTWRCCGCRVPLRFTDGLPALNFDRDMHTDAPAGWRVPDRTLESQNCIRLLGAKLLGGPRPVTEVRDEMKLAGYSRKLVDEAVRFLHIRQRQIARPGPVHFVLPDEKLGNVAQWAIDLLVGALK